MAHLQYMPGDPRLVDQLVYELKSKGIFDQFRKDCIADVDTRPAYQNLRQRVESSVAAFLSRQIWKPDLNKNQLREKLRKHLLDGNYLEQGVERIVDQVVNPKVASVFIPQVEDLVYNYLGIPRKKSTANTETSDGKSTEDLLPTDLEAVSPGSVKSNDDKNEAMDVSENKEETKMDIDEKSNADLKEDSIIEVVDNSNTADESRMSVIEINQDSPSSIDKSTTTIPLPAEEIKLENIPAPENSPPNIKDKKIDLDKIDLPKEPNVSTDIPLPDEIPKMERSVYFQPLGLASEEDTSSEDSSLQRNVSPLTPIRNYNNENSCDAQQGFDNDSDSKGEVKQEPTTFRFAIENNSPEKSPEPVKEEKKEPEQELSFQFTNQVNINAFNTPMYDESSNSNNLRIDYESDANSKTTDIKPPETDQNSVDSKKEKKPDEKKNSSHKSSHRSRDSHRHSSSNKDKRSESKHSSSRDSHRHDKKSSKDDKSKSTSNRDKTIDKGDKTSEKVEKSNEKSEKKDSKDRESSKHRSSSSSHKSSKDKDSKHRSSTSSKHSSSRHDDKKSSSSSKDKSSDKSKDSKDKSRDKSSSHRSDKDKDRKSSSKSKSEKDEKENKEKKEKKETDDHYSLSGRGNPNRRSTDRDSNDGSSSSKGSHNPSSGKSSESKKETKSSSKSEHTASDNSSSPSDKDVNAKEHKVNNLSQKVVRVDTRLEVPMMSPPRLPFVPDVTLKKPRFAANLAEAKQMMKMRKFLEEEQKRMNQEAALLLEFQANVRPSLSQVYSSIPGPELEFACVPNSVNTDNQVVVEELPVSRETVDVESEELTEVFIVQEENPDETVEEQKDSIAETLIAMHLEHNVHNRESDIPNIEQTHHDIIQTLTDDDELKNEIEQGNVQLIIECENDGNNSIICEENDQIDTEEHYEVAIIIEEPENDDEKEASSEHIDEYDHVIPEEIELHYFGEPEKYIAELEKDRFSRFLKSYTEKIPSKMYLINCDSYEENLIKEVSNDFGNFEIVNYHKNGYLKIPNKTKNVIKNVTLNTEVIIPPKINNGTFTNASDSDSDMASGMFSPVKSESSFDLHSDYDAKLEEMVTKASRQQIMEIILGNIEESPSKMPSIEYCMESSIETPDYTLKRKFNEVESNVNNNISVLTSNKIRKLSGSDQISSTTEETEETPNNGSLQNNKKSKYLGKARRVGLPKPKKTALPNPNSPSSDQSVENYTTNIHETSAKRAKTPRNKVQRYDTSDLYKPKLHFLSRRNFSLNE